MKQFWEKNVHIFGFSPFDSVFFRVLGFCFSADHNLSSYEKPAHCLSISSFWVQIRVLKNFQNAETNAESVALKEEIAVATQFFGPNCRRQREMENGKL